MIIIYAFALLGRAKDLVIDCFWLEAPLTSCQDPLFWDQRYDWSWRGAGGHHAAGSGHEEDGAEHVRRPQRWSQRQPWFQPRGPRGHREKEVRLLMAPPAATLSTLFFMPFFSKLCRVKLLVKLDANLRFQSRAMHGVTSVSAVWCYLFTCVMMISKKDFPWLCISETAKFLCTFVNMYAQFSHLRKIPFFYLTLWWRENAGTSSTVIFSMNCYLKIWSNFFYGWSLVI